MIFFFLYDFQMALQAFGKRFRNGVKMIQVIRTIKMSVGQVIRNL